MALALYRRYRPDTFEGVIGQDQVTVPLMRALDENKLTHAYLFSGPRGCGKTSSARILARCVNCAKGPTSHPCGECESCRDLATGGPGSIDVVEIDAASHNGVDDARELRDRVAAMPARDRYKIFILDEAHMVTPQGFNALLKTVEEPPDHVMFIFATTEPDKVIGTIRSRTHHYPFRLVPSEVMGPYLEDICAKEGIKPEPGVLKLTMRAGGGSVRDTLSVLDQLMVGAVDGVITQDSAVALLGFTPDALIGEAVDAVIGRDGEALYGVVQKVIVGGFDPRRFVEDLLARVRDLLVLTLGGAKAESVLSDDAAAEDMDDLKRQSQALGLARLTDMAETINTALGAMSGATSPRMRLELLAARLLAGPVVVAAAPEAGGSAAGVGAGPAASVSGSAAPGGASAPVPAQRGGFAGSSRRPRGGFAGSSRQQETNANASAAGSAPASASVAVPGNAPAAPFAQPGQAGMGGQSGPVSQPGQVGQFEQPEQPAQSQPAQSQPAQSQPAAPDNRTPDEKWDALVAGLPSDVAAYVSRAKVPRINLRQDPHTGAGKLWIKFDTPLSKYAFAIAMSDEEVDGSRKVVDILRAETRKMFGEQVRLAPTEKMADGQVAPPLSHLPADEQRRIKSQIAMMNAGLAAAGLAAVVGGGAARGKDDAATAPAEDHAASDADDVHRGGSSALPSDDPWASGPAGPSAGVAWGSASGTAAAGASDADDDPWATPPQHRTAPAEPVHETPQPEHHKHVAVPDLSDDTDPWATPAPAVAAPVPLPTQSVATPATPGTSAAPIAPNAPAAPAVQTHPFAPSAQPPQHHAFALPTDPVPAAPPIALPTDPVPGGPAGGPGSAAQGPSALPYEPEPDGDGAGMPYEPEPDDPWTRPISVPTVPPMPSTHPGRHPVSGPEQRTGWQPDPQSAAGQGMRPDVDPDDDEYSMNDEVLGQATAMGVEDLKKLFEVKKVEEFAADDPRNPNNVQRKTREEE